MTTTVKTCFKCHVEKPLTDYYVHPRMGDQRSGKCKVCTRKDVSANYYANIEAYKSYEKTRARLPHRVAARAKYARTDGGKEAYKRAHAEYSRKYPLKYIAHNMTGNAIRDGKLIKQPCEVCGAERVDAHHDDYSKPLDVRWLCRKHHLEHHGKSEIEAA